MLKPEKSYFVSFGISEINTKRGVVRVAHVRSPERAKEIVETTLHEILAQEEPLVVWTHNIQEYKDFEVLEVFETPTDE